MKAICFVGERQPDLARLTSAFPQLQFILARSSQETARALGEAEILIINGNDYTAAMADAARASPALRWIQFTSSGLDGALKHGPLPPGVSISNVAGLRAGNLSEHGFALLLFLCRRLRRIEAARAERAWRHDAVFGDMVSLRGRTMLIVGMGAIGQALAQKAQAFGMRVIAVSRAFAANDVVTRVYARANALDAFRVADVVMIAAASDPGARRFVDRAKLAVMKPSAFLINVSRGDIVDEEGLLEACRERRIAGAGLDVFGDEPLAADSAFWGLDNVVVTPHVGGAGSDQLEQLLDMIAENLERYIAGRPLLRKVTA